MTRGGLAAVFGVAYGVVTVLMLVLYGIGAALLLITGCIVAAVHEEALHRLARKDLR